MPATARPKRTDARRPEWIGVATAAEILGRSPRVVKRLAAEGHIRTHRPPGARPFFCRADVEALAPPSSP